MTTANQTREEIVNELGLSALSSEEQDRILGKMSEALLKRIFLETMENLSETDRKQLADMLEKNPQIEEVEKFMAEKIPNHKELFEKVRDDFKKDFRESVNVLAS